jgi:hypothetical protein
MTDLSKLPGVDPEVPNAARMYDYYLGGSHNFAADRAAAERVKSAVPFAVDVARANRFFMIRAVRFCVEEGIDQFLDLGSGIPTVGNVHEVALGINPQARVAYVDNEPVTVASAAALLEGEPQVTITMADIRDVDAVFAAPGVRDLLDLSRPVALLMVAVLPFIPDEDDPAGLAERYRNRLAPDSFLVLSHGSADQDSSATAAAAEVYRRTANPVKARTRSEIAEMLRGTELVEPGLVDATEWRPEDTTGGQHRMMLAAVGRIR